MSTGAAPEETPYSGPEPKSGTVRRRGLLLVNLGTPDAPDAAAVRRYLREFLMDARVLDIAAWKRSLLVNAIIAPFRGPKSADAYQKIWTERGSPLLFHTADLAEKVQARLEREAPGRWRVAFAMRYQRPALGTVLDALRAEGVDEVVALPLYPQYASSSYGSTAEALYAACGRPEATPLLSLLPPFYEHPAFVRALAAVARPVIDDLRPDKVLMSFHGLPERHMRQSDLSGGAHCLASATCCERIVEANRYCYRAQSYATARALAAELGLGPEGYEVAFQSRLTKEPWIQPFTDVRLQELARAGVKRLAVTVPSFVADCLETLEEIGIRGREDFIAHGGEDLRLIPCVNSHDAWVEAVVAMLRDRVTL